VSEGLRAVLVAFGGLALLLTWQSIRTSAVPASSPDRLIAELRLAQFAALILTLTAGAYIGFAVIHEHQQGVGLDVALAVGFLLLAALTMVRDPRQGLTIVALAFAGHAIVDVLHRPGLLPEDLAPPWYSIGCAVYDVYLGALCYLPMLKR
jgi:cbb3-type cytochrome oxidase subunit 1